MELSPPIETVDTDAPRLDCIMYGYVEYVARARGLVDHAIDAWALAPELRDDAFLVVTELTANACRLYTGQKITIWVSAPVPGLLTIGVVDPDPLRLPRVLAPSMSAESGRGLYMVRELTCGRLGWRVHNETRSKTVFATLGPVTKN